MFDIIPNISTYMLVFKSLIITMGVLFVPLVIAINYKRNLLVKSIAPVFLLVAGALVTLLCSEIPNHFYSELGKAKYAEVLPFALDGLDKKITFFKLGRIVDGQMFLDRAKARMQPSAALTTIYSTSGRGQ